MRPDDGGRKNSQKNPALRLGETQGRGEGTSRGIDRNQIRA